ncbi:MAG: glycosyltransferase family 4 protein [Patescibacteria group bacterium]
MNILIDIRCLLDRPYTGVAQYTLNFLNEILEKDKKNNYFLFYNSLKLRNKDLIQFNSFNFQIIDFHWPNKIFNFLLRFLKWPKIDKLVEKRIGQKIDKIFLPNFNFVAFSKDKKITLVVHDLSFEIYPQFFTLKQRLWHKLVNPRHLVHQATKIITHSENTKNDLINLYQISPQKIIIEKPPLHREFKKLEKNDSEILRVKEKYQLPEKFIFYLGRLEPRKNLETIIFAFHRLITEKSITYHLVIAGEGKEMKRLKKIVKKLKIDDKVRFLGYIPEKDKCPLYNLAKVFIYLSFYEGYGYPVSEALACQTFVISSCTSSLTEIESDKIIFINPYDINDLTQAIKQFL